MQIEHWLLRPQLLLRYQRARKRQSSIPVPAQIEFLQQRTMLSGVGDEGLVAGAEADDMTLEEPANEESPIPDDIESSEQDSLPGNEQETPQGDEIETPDSLPGDADGQEVNKSPKIDLDLDATGLQDYLDLRLGPDRSGANDTVRHLHHIGGSDPEGDDLTYSILGGSEDFADFFELKNESHHTGAQIARLRLNPGIEYGDLYDKRPLWQLTLQVRDSNGNTDTGTLSLLLSRTAVGIIGDSFAVEGTDDKIKIKFVRVTGENDPLNELTVRYRFKWGQVKYIESKYLEHVDLGVAAPGADGYTEGTISIKQGKFESDDLTITAISDADSGIESVLFEVIDGNDYVAVINPYEPGNKVETPEGPKLTRWLNLQVLSGMTLFGKKRPNGMEDSTVIHMNDILQGGIGDCSLWTAVALLVKNPPLGFSWSNLITQNGPKSFTVHFPNAGDKQVELNLTSGYDSARLSGEGVTRSPRSGFCCGV